MEAEDRFQAARDEMVRKQIQRRGIRDPRLLNVMRHIPRHLFLPPNLHERAYDDGPLPIGQAQTISQPYIVAAMTDLLNLRGDERVLEVGTGSGYQAAVLGDMAEVVHTVERHGELADHAHRILEALGYRNVFIHIGDGTLGWSPGAPYQAIIVTAAAPQVPAPLIEQLDEGGRLIIPIGDRFGQNLERWRKIEGQMHRENLFPVAFVPLLGRFGWHKEEWEETS